MGDMIGWTAIRGKAPDTIISELGMHRVSNPDSQRQSYAAGGMLTTGWYLIIVDARTKHLKDLAAGKLCESLSRGCELVYGYVNEIVMVSTASGFVDGQCVWEIIHNGGEDAVYHLETHGKPPASYKAIHDRLKAQQDSEGAKEGVDFMFDIPVDVAHSVVGFRYDQEPQLIGGAQFEALALRETPGLWQRLLSRFSGQG